ncbi:MAG TPA: hypothetical protein VGL94_18225 [Ktedonobacteraceae bacterium]
MDRRGTPGNSSREEGTSTQGFTRQRRISTDSIGYPLSLTSSRSRVNSASENTAGRQFATRESDNTPIKKTGTRDSGEASPEALSRKIKENIAFGMQLLRQDNAVLFTAVLNDMEKSCQRAIRTIDSTKYMRFASLRVADERNAAFMQLREYASRSESLGEFAQLYGKAQSYIKELNEISPLGLQIQPFNEYIQDLPTIKARIDKQSDNFVTNYCRDLQRFQGYTTTPSEKDYRDNAVKELKNKKEKLKSIMNDYTETREKETRAFREAADNIGDREEGRVYKYLNRVNTSPFAQSRKGKKPFLVLF